ncbi:MAG: hypothetical protein SGI84_11975 [Gemmatimonadota bacterium]|nr:hypothetical protein [Gemmatimonadota bacterium]
MRRILLAVLVSAPLVGACSDPNFLNPPTSENIIISARLWAIQGTPINLPSAWSVPLRTRIRLDQSPNFDFAFDINPAGQPVLLPRGAFGLLEPTGNPGLLPTPKEWDEITLAVLNGYLTSDTIPIATGDRLYVRSSSTGICFNSAPLYAKMQILEIDLTDRSVLYRILTDANCGYKGLELGLPTK